MTTRLVRLLRTFVRRTCVLYHRKIKMQVFFLFFMLIGIHNEFFYSIYTNFYYKNGYFYTNVDYFEAVYHFSTFSGIQTCYNSYLYKKQQEFISFWYTNRHFYPYVYHFQIFHNQFTTFP